MYARIDSAVISTQKKLFTLEFLWYTVKFWERINCLKKRSIMLKIVEIVGMEK